MDYKDNDSFGGGSYPEPNDDGLEVSGTITIKFKFKGVFDNDMTSQDIAEYVADNPRDFMDEIDEVEEVSID